ncbi:MAG: hypothetical protein QOE26_2785 [Verrucomicrobiota bacterium]|jgi:hypothetical protein
MRKKRESKTAAKYDSVYRFRCLKTLKKRADRVARERGHGDASDVGREGVVGYVEKEEKRLGLAAFVDNGK